MGQCTKKSLIFFSIIIGIFLTTDNWTFGLPLRELGTKPVLLFLTIFSIAPLNKYSVKLSNNFKFLAFLLILIISTYSVFLNGSSSLKQVSLLFFVFSSLFFLNKPFLHEKSIVLALLVVHSFFFVIDIFGELNSFRSLITYTINNNPKPRGLFSEHSWASMILGAIPLIFLNNIFKFSISFFLVSWIIISFTDSGTGLFTVLLSATFFIIIRIKESLVKLNWTYLILFGLGLFFLFIITFSNRFSVDYSESNAIRLLTPFYLLKSGFQNFCFGVGIGGQLNYLSMNSFSELSILSEFSNAELGNTESRFNSFNLFIRIWSSFGLLSFPIFMFLGKAFYWSLTQNKYIVIISLYALVSAFSNDSFNNSFIVLLICFYLQSFYLGKNKKNIQI